MPSKKRPPKPPTIETQAPEGCPTRTCSACLEVKPTTHFDCLPADPRCRDCLPVDVARAKSQELIDLAHRKLAQIFDANEKDAGLPALETMIKSAYGAWGGTHTFCQDIKAGYDALVAQKKYNAAVNVQMGLMKLHARVDKMKQEDDWRQMDDDRLKESLQIQLMHLLAVAALKKEVTDLMKAHGQNPEQVLYGIVSPDE